MDFGEGCAIGSNGKLLSRPHIGRTQSVRGNNPDRASEGSMMMTELQEKEGETMQKTIILVAMFFCGMGSPWLQAEPEECDALQFHKQRSAPTKNLPIQGEVFRIKDRTAFLILPKKPQAGRPIPWVWYAPTLPGLPGGAEKWMFEKFLEKGIAIAGVDVGESYGSPAGRVIYSALHDELVKKRGLAAQACLLTRSRGGLMLYCWAAENPGKVKCITGIYPVCNIASYPGLERACGAYGLTAEQLKAQLSEHNPIDRLAPLARAKVPIFHIHGDQDRVVPLEANSGLVKQRYDQLGGEMTLEVVKGQGHNLWVGWFQSQKLVDFILLNAAR